VRILPKEERRPAVLNWGVRPTFGATEPVLEVHLPGFAGDLAGSRLAVEIVDRIRGEKAFSGPEELRERIAEDVREAGKRLSWAPGGP
jgi:riboflavin kinase/FMN adenylyltransferase